MHYVDHLVDLRFRVWLLEEHLHQQRMMLSLHERNSRFPLYTRPLEHRMKSTSRSVAGSQR